MPGPIDALKQVNTTGAGPTDPEALIRQRQAVNATMGGQPAPQAPFQAQPNPLGQASHGGFSFHQTTPDIEGLVAALKGGGMTGSRPGGNIDLDAQQAEPQMSFDDLMKRANAIR